MREIDVSLITAAVKNLCISTNRVLPCDLESCISDAAKKLHQSAGLFYLICVKI